MFCRAALARIAADVAAVLDVINLSTSGTDLLVSTDLCVCV